jgi:histidinol-phosphatase (PHP family)
MWANYHCHSTYCDGKESPGGIVRQAEAISLHSLGISSHAPLPFPMPWSMRPERLADYLAALQQLGATSPVPVYTGLEVDFVPGVTGPGRFASSVDFTIGSVHFAGSFPDGRRFETDGPHSHFREGVETIYAGSIPEAVKEYFRLTREMLASDPPAVLGHCDKIKMHNRDDTSWNEQDGWYLRELDDTLEAAAAAGVIVEVNTRGVYLGRVKEPYPGVYALRKILRMGIPITLSSDAHHPKDLVNGFRETASLLLHLGFRNLRILHRGEWTDVPFTVDGLHL